jgi:hypothetical protein
MSQKGTRGYARPCRKGIGHVRGPPRLSLVLGSEAAEGVSDGAQGRQRVGLLLQNVAPYS